MQFLGINKWSTFIFKYKLALINFRKLMRGSVVCVEGRDDLKSGKNKQSKSLFTSSWQFCVDCSQQWTKDKVYAV